MVKKDQIYSKKLKQGVAKVLEDILNALGKCRIIQSILQHINIWLLQKDA